MRQPFLLIVLPGGDHESHPPALGMVLVAAPPHAGAAWAGTFAAAAALLLFMMALVRLRILQNRAGARAAGMPAVFAPKGIAGHVAPPG